MATDGNRIKNTNLRIPPHILNAIRHQGELEGRSQNSAIVWAVVEYLNARGTNIKMIEGSFLAEEDDSSGKHDGTSG